MNRTDAELDRDWQPSGRRPQSTIARSFSQELMDIFKIENSIADLDEKIDKRKQQVNSGQTELEALEARIKEMEARLKRSQQSSPARGSQRAQRSGLSDAFGQTSQAAQSTPSKELPQIPRQGSRPGTAKQAQQAPLHGGAMPPTPTASEGEPATYSHHHLFSTSHCSNDDAVETRSFADYVIVFKDGGDRDI